MAELGVTDVHRITVRRDGIIKPTNTFVLTFNSPTLRTVVKVGFGAVFASKGYPFKNIFGFTTAGEWDCVAAIERLPALHYSVDFSFLSVGIMGFFGEL